MACCIEGLYAVALLLLFLFTGGVVTPSMKSEEDFNHYGAKDSTYYSFLMWHYWFGAATVCMIVASICVLGCTNVQRTTAWVWAVVNSISGAFCVYGAHVLLPTDDGTSNENGLDWAGWFVTVLVLVIISILSGLGVQEKLRCHSSLECFALSEELVTMRSFSWMMHYFFVANTVVFFVLGLFRDLIWPNDPRQAAHLWAYVLLVSGVASCVGAYRLSVSRTTHVQGG
eukprot:CAMPEP_0167777704 /NCGR_PEP_ID=MMETSP0111_2-20121227/3851_1 /TAXON_ID=91324 /ORGANISM="Lotharella globosa, Strain CCCM811" /LENGTH=227 /DNA_ID=CAMNT_0007667937 /DNA_START=40 /DNA_END=719 /DNA_ORIENTATION=-